MSVFTAFNIIFAKLDIIKVRRKIIITETIGKKILKKSLILAFL